MATFDTLTVRDLRRRWKPTKERLAKERAGHPTSIRIHRACSWIERAEALSQLADPDTALICRWVAFNSLYGQWDTHRREPKADRTSWRDFLNRVVGLDSSGEVPKVLNEGRDLVVSILEDEYLSDFFWEEPGVVRAKKSKKSMYDARTWYLEGKYALILDRVIERVHLMRCQLVHGAATHGSKLNRGSLETCSKMLSLLLPVVLAVIIDRGAEEDWGSMCYPPLSGGPKESSTPEPRVGVR